MGKYYIKEIDGKFHIYQKRFLIKNKFIVTYNSDFTAKACINEFNKKEEIKKWFKKF